MFREETLISILLKKTKLTMLFNSTKHVLSVLHALLHVITNKIYQEGVINIPILMYEETEAQRH